MSDGPVRAPARGTGGAGAVASLDVIESAARVDPELLFRALLEYHPEPTFSLTADGRVLACNPAFSRFLGRSVEAVIGAPFPSLAGEAHRDAAARAIAAVRGGRAQSWKAEFPGPDETVSIGYVTLAPVVAAGAIVGAQGVARDVTVYSVIEEQLQARIFTDPLTGLANRPQLLESIDRACRRARAAGQVAVLFLDIDDFKLVNDALGHGAGDALLVGIADRLRGATRGHDVVARLGGDEFAILLDVLGEPNDAMVVVTRIHAALHQPIEVDGRPLRANASIGVAYWDGATSGAGLLRSADLAMYRAKALGKGRSAVFDAHMESTARERLELASDLREAIRAERLEAVFQPIVDLATGAVLKAEALARWTHPTRGPVSPAVFIPLAEEMGLIEDLGALMLRLGCRQLRRWQDEAGAGHVASRIAVTVNVSGRQVDRPGALAQAVREALAESGADPTGLTLELTESVAMRHPERMLETMTELAAAGVSIAIDDFGTGYSSLSYLRRFPVHVLKIDKSFVDGLATDPRDTHAEALVRTILSVAAALSLAVVAEGVETEGQRDALVALGCQMGQGYLFGRPGPASGLLAR